VKKWSDRLGRIVERRIVGVDFDLRHQADDMARVAGFAQDVLESLCEQIGGRALRLRDEDVERLRRDAFAGDGVGQ
jgi:hypothetical protein